MDLVDNGLAGPNMLDIN